MKPRSIQYCEEWHWNDFQDNLFSKLILGSSLHVCSGRSGLGDVRLDLFEPADVKASMMNLPFKDITFDTVISDPPWGYFKGRWRQFARFMFELRRVARKRIILRIDNLFFHLKGWQSKIYAIRPNFGCLVSLLIVYDRESLLLSDVLEQEATRQ